MTSTSHIYFIITEKPEFSGHISAGCICYISEYKHRRHGSSSQSLSVIPFSSQSGLDYPIDLRCMTELSAAWAELLLALPEDAERLRWFREGAVLQAALELKVGTVVVVQEGEEERRGVIRYIGRLEKPKYPHPPLSAVFFGIQLQGADRGKGPTNLHDISHSCAKDCSIFAPFSRVRPLVPSSLSPPAVPDPPQSLQTEELAVGDRVTYFLEDLYLDLSLNSMVEFTLATGNSYGIIRWIGTLPDREQIMAGLELEEERGVSDGTFKSERFFSCPPKRALFLRLSSCRPDSRFQSESANHGGKMPEQQEDAGVTDHGTLETVPPIGTEQVSQILTGRMKGIQGHCNSCYMDAALFSLFSCSSVLDSMLFKSTAPQDAPIQKTLLRDIVNPLRSKGFVEGRHIMKLRQQLQKHGYSHSFTTDEKDPEEFLIVIMHHILALEPLLKLSAGGEVQESYCYQIFLDQNHSLVLPTVQQLLEHSFHTAGLKLAEVPSCLILQMPRFGKKFKMFDKIIPSLELDITELLSEGPLQCILCGDMAEQQCTDCFKDPVFSLTGFKVFCGTCSSQVHSHPQRGSHRPAALDIPTVFLGCGAPHTLTRDKLELFAVLCIETSHYVSFIKHGPSAEDWIFFDSMADRQGESDGYNIPEVRSCPELGAYLEMSPAELAAQVPRDMKGVAKRLYCDAYMYLYQSSSMCLYR
ncbi:putative ubiquitin carboxyl-terminal hydrolase CYLD-like [Scophthalmus maximus]|uniref:Ubiquitin carboxyl-terminal hydrolase CYLD n=1 Tax=Scophthalmus maximus TaxID=52904 RepID=A0A2U9C1N5_SCOMX|nr:putative ubiquitin carboxyl-terminal hydrolase CYLD-like [Scophthalmus maximus]